jgi:peroxiredoxin
MNKVTDDLRNSGIMDRAIKEGQKAPPFELENSHGRRVSLSNLLREGLVVLTFFRGHW